MPPFEVFHTTAFRWAVVIAASFACLSLCLFAFVYWQTEGYESRELDGSIGREHAFIAPASAAEQVERLDTWLSEDHHSVRYGLLAGADGRKLSGNMAERPAVVPVDGALRFMVTQGIDGDADDDHEIIRGASFALPGGRVLTLGIDTDELDHMHDVILRALGLGLIPMVLMGLTGGVLLGRRALQRVAAVDLAVARVMRGQMGERLPLRGNRDEFDRLATGVNDMLDEIERLLNEVRGVGDSVAHDLRTPLTRMRARLETSRDTIGTPASFREAIDEALHWLDQTLGVITAVLRIGELEHGRRQAAFRPFDVASLLREAYELYEPLAEEKDITLSLSVEAESACLVGDRDLMLETVVNLLDNAIKFTPRGGRCQLCSLLEENSVLISVCDNGPGIRVEELGAVLKRFHRAERSRSIEGSGLGLALVAAVVRLHGMTLSVHDNAPGCCFELRASTRSDGMPLEAA